MLWPSTVFYGLKMQTSENGFQNSLHIFSPFRQKDKIQKFVTMMTPHAYVLRVCISNNWTDRHNTAF